MVVTKLAERIRFLLSASNEHGVHSPFVYAYVTKCLYTGSKIGKRKSLGILEKSMAYFATERLALYGSYEHLKNRLLQKFPNLRFQETPYDMIAMDVTDALNLGITVPDKTNVHNNTMILIDNIHLNKNNLLVWERIKENSRVTVTIDLYYCGLVFFRKEQAKEHFKIRI